MAAVQLAPAPCDALVTKSLAATTVRVAEALVVVPAQSVTLTLNCRPLSARVTLESTMSETMTVEK